MKDLRIMDLENQLKHDRVKLDQATSEGQKLKEDILVYKERIMTLEHELVKMADYHDVSLREMDRKLEEEQRQPIGFRSGKKTSPQKNRAFSSKALVYPHL